jgi:pimeloyl-ACP methyl ester carboxylesterase
MAIDDVVLLVPGFLGFDHFGGFYYFADRAVAALRASIERLDGWRPPVPVIPVTTHPTGSLRKRQRALIGILEALDGVLGGVSRFHLVGHSTGGLDAELLVESHDADGNAWSGGEVREKVRSIVTLAAPHHGTGLAESALGELLIDPRHHPEGAKELVGLLGAALRAKPLRSSRFQEILANAISDLSSTARFFAQGIRHMELIADLAPARVAEIRAGSRPDPDVRITCFITAALPSATGDRCTDPLYERFFSLTRGRRAGGPGPVRRACERLSSAPRVIRSEGSEIPAFDEGVSDGVVNSCRQLLDPDDPDQLGALVLADHGDVIGYYDREDLLLDVETAGTVLVAQALDAGIFRSGAQFGDDQFFELYAAVAQALSPRSPSRAIRSEG